MTKRENSTAERHRVDPFAEIGYLADRLMLEYMRDPSNTEARDAAFALHAMADRHSGKLAEWSRKARAYFGKAGGKPGAGFNRGPIVDRSRESDALRNWVERDLKAGLSARDVAAAFVRRLRVCPLVGGDTRVPLTGPPAAPEFIDAAERALSEFLMDAAPQRGPDPELAIVAMLKALGCDRTKANNTFKRRPGNG